MAKAPPIGIDLGTTNTCVAVYDQGIVNIIPIDDSNTMPSCIAFTETERMIGRKAVNNAVNNPKNTVYDVKRFIGRKYSDSSIQTDLKRCLFVYDDNDNPMIKVEYRCEEAIFTPEEISSMILQKVKVAAKAFLKKEVTDAVITVPANFTDAQRRATHDAAKIADLNVLKLIHEPTSAAVAYGLNKNFENSKSVLIFDFGGGTLDVTVLTMKLASTVFNVAATAGDSHLGGIDIDNILIDHCVQNFEREHKINPCSNLTAMHRLKSECVKAKELLSTVAETTIEVEKFHVDIDLKIKLTRARFNELCQPLFTKAMKLIDKALRDAEVNKGSVDDVVMVGGSSKILKVQDLLRQYFFWKEPKTTINPDEAIAYGAAVQAAILSGVSEVKDVLLLDVTPLSIGLETAGGVMEKIIKRNMPIPCQESVFVSTSTDNQKTVQIKVYKGERLLTEDNELLDQFELTDLPLRPRKEVEIKVTFKIDEDGILNVNAVHMATGNSKSVTIKRDRGGHSEEEIQKMLAVAHKYEKDDKDKLKRLRMRKCLFEYVHTVKGAACSDCGKVLTMNEKEKINNYFKTVTNWLENNVTAEIDEIHYYGNQVREYLSPLCNKMGFVVNEKIEEESKDKNDQARKNPKKTIPETKLSDVD